MRVATWNVNSLRARLPFVIHWLRERRPDAVAIQELKTTDEEFPGAELAEAGYHAAVHGQKGWNGVAVLSRERAEAVTTGLPGEEEQGARFLTARVAGLLVASVYVPNGKTVEHEDFPRKLAWLDSLARHLREAHDPGGALLLGGDFNLCPGALDTWNEKEFAGRIFHTVEERARFQALLDWGLHDLYRELHPDARTYSWWDYRGGAFHRGLGLRIDFLLGTRELRSRVRTVEVDREYRKKKEGVTASDHAPVIADLAD
jgi:exodeoxyribonuclease-3